MVVLGIILASLTLLGFTRIGIRAVRRPDGTNRLVLRVGLLRFNLLKMLKKDVKSPPKKLQKEKKSADEKKAAFTLSNIGQMLKLSKTLLGKLRKGVRVRTLALSVTVGGGDPYNTAMTYARMHMLWGAVHPILTEMLYIKKSDVSISMDFDQEKTVWYGEADVTLTIGRAAAIAFSALSALLKLTIQKNNNERRDPSWKTKTTSPS